MNCLRSTTRRAEWPRATDPFLEALLLQIGGAGLATVAGTAWGPNDSPTDQLVKPLPGVLAGVTFGCQLAVQFAADFPDRAQALVLVGGWAKLTRILGFDFEADPGQVGAWAGPVKLCSTGGQPNESRRRRLRAEDRQSKEGSRGSGI